MAQQVTPTQELLDYIRGTSLRDDELLAGLRAETAALPAGEAMQVMAEEGQLLALLVALTGARSILEIGTFTGYSTLCMARALPPGGELVTCDLTERWPAIGAGYWEQAEVADRIELRIGDAVETLAKLTAERGPESFDLVFIDADKANYPRYYEGSFALLRPGGLLVVDNTLFFGRVADPAAQDPDTEGVRELNAALYADERVDISLLTVADGITLVRKRS
ncbi:O-methyltransferase [Kitasatospora sp. NPDC058406]|uniref:O-methyltransferase n=1 Tax=Kitasatospora sp. NPDC058406 TaxID=3346483 RepID=UPI00364E0CB1